VYSVVVHGVKLWPQKICAGDVEISLISHGTTTVLTVHEPSLLCVHSTGGPPAALATEGALKIVASDTTITNSPRKNFFILLLKIGKVGRDSENFSPHFLPIGP
jgi:hypothetical protein